ncbi:MAG: DUF2490 domain-containing protein [Prevotella sp.]|nr:DUF2490 domain-containing protein [Prevotella sp.]
MKRITILMAVCLATMVARAQSDDFGIWTSIEVQKKIDKKWSAGFEAEFRLQDNAKELDRWTAGVGGVYKPTKWLKFEAGYKFIRYYTLAETKGKITKYLDDDELEPKNIKIRTSDSYWNSRHRVFFAATLHKKFGNFEVSLREQGQYNFRPETSMSRYGMKYMLNEWDSEVVDSRKDLSEIDTVKSKSTFHLRSRLQVEYDKKGLKWKPFASVEMYNGGDNFGIDKMRYTAGVEYKINKKHSVEVYYRYQHKSSADNGESAFNAVKNFTDDSGTPVYDLTNTNYDPSFFGRNDRSTHVLGFDYKFKF